MRGNFFFVFVVAFLAGVFFRTLYQVPQVTIWFIVGASLLGLCFGFLATSIRGYVLFVASLALLLGIGRMSMVSSWPPEQFESLIGEKVTLQGTIATDPDVRETSDRITVVVERNQEKMKLIAVAPPFPAFVYGEQVTVSGQLTAPAPFASDGGRIFRYDQFLAKDGVYALIQKASVHETGPPRGFVDISLNFLYGIKGTFEKSLQRALPEPYVSLAVGILVGGKQGLGPALLADFTIAGMLQIVVLSGYNVMVVAEAVLKACSRLPRLFSFTLAAFCIIAFVIAAGANSSAIRAGIMAVIAVFARVLYRKYDVLRALFASLLLMVLVNPLLLTFDPGLQLSFLATLGLVLISPIIAVWFVWVKSAFLRDALATTLSAQIAVLPLLLYQSGNLSLVAIPANVLVMPAVPVAMAAGAVAAVIAILLPPLGPVAGLPAYALLWYIIKVAVVAARLPYAQVILPAFSAWWLFAAYAALILLFTLLHRGNASRRYSNPYSPETHQRTDSSPQERSPP